MLETCKDCEYNNSFYGCLNQDCDVYQDIKAEVEYEEEKDE